MPTPFRGRFAEEILQTAQDHLNQAKDSGSPWKALWCRLHILVDALAAVFLEHGRSLRRQHPKFAGILPILLTVLSLGVFIGWLDLTNTEVQVAVAALLLSGFAIGLARPRRAWVWAGFLGLSVPVAQAVSLLADFRPPYPHDWHTVLEAFMAFIPAFLGMYGGILVRCCLSWFVPNGQSSRNEG